MSRTEHRINHIAWSWGIGRLSGGMTAKHEVREDVYSSSERGYKSGSGAPETWAAATEAWPATNGACSGGQGGQQLLCARKSVGSSFCAPEKGSMQLDGGS